MIEDNGDHLNPASAAYHPSYPDGADLIADERVRQIAKGFTEGKDDGHTGGELLACAKLVINDVQAETFDNCAIWPLQRAGHVRNKYGKDYVRRLVIAGALIAAEIDRLLRLNERQREPSAGPPVA